MVFCCLDIPPPLLSLCSTDHASYWKASQTCLDSSGQTQKPRRRHKAIAPRGCYARSCIVLTPERALLPSSATCSHHSQWSRWAADDPHRSTCPPQDARAHGAHVSDCGREMEFLEKPTQTWRKGPNWNPNQDPPTVDAWWGNINVFINLLSFLHICASDPPEHPT